MAIEKNDWWFVLMIGDLFTKLDGINYDIQF